MEPKNFVEARTPHIIDSYRKNLDNFKWFGHMWSHMQSIMFPTDEALCSYMQQNRDFANRHSLPLETGYAVSPHHAGVYPVHEPLYHCWREIWGVTVTSTEEYPHLRPDRLRRGFIHQVRTL